MPNRSRKHADKDFNQIARSVVDQATGQRMAKKKTKKKDPIAVELGRRGGLKGGRSRADKMTAEERAESARKAARARWAKQSEQ